MKTILLIIALLIPATVLAGGYQSGGHRGGYSRAYSHSYRSYYYPGYYSGYHYRSPYFYRSHRNYRHYHGSAFTSQGFDYSAYPTGNYYRPDPPDFQYQSITPSAAPEGVHTWTDKEGIVHFTDDAGKAPTR